MTFEKKRKNRSDNYQWRLLEITCSNDTLSSFQNGDSIYNRLNPWHYDDELMDLEEQLKIEFWRIVDTLLTDRQKEVITLYASGLTQIEIAKKLGVNQSSITKSINGNIDYGKKDKNGNKVITPPKKGEKISKGKRSFGGILKRIDKIVSSDEKIKEILERMVELRREKY